MIEFLLTKNKKALLCESSKAFTQLFELFTITLKMIHKQVNTFGCKQIKLNYLFFKGILNVE